MPGTPRLQDFRVLRTLNTRWMDQDVYGHVNNVVYYAYFDTVVNGYLIEASGIDVRRLPAVGLVAETQCRFLRELHFPGDVVAGLRLDRLGRTSVSYRIALFQDDSAAAVGRFVHVYVDAETRRPTPVPSALQPCLQALTLA